MDQKEKLNSSIRTTVAEFKNIVLSEIVNKLGAIGEMLDDSEMKGDRLYTVSESISTMTVSIEKINSKIETDLRYINKIFKEGELVREATVAFFATVQIEGGRKVERDIEYFNLDVIISVGYRVKSKRGTQFRIWANSVLKEYIIKGFAIFYEGTWERKYLAVQCK
ncbi:RhuM family protein [Butyrivibrio sp. ob235]|uniref:RhuM family protein n=1 Tax=Butyrivibrio sp. ob235 TaxID=1761780 RepID=UPI002E8DF91C|nr:RhuM family protein [Butyrivibrio sp. ob235]